ncbi:MAG: hypothetical protein ACR2GP_15495 [Burkholderiaceae bacterium]
MRALPAPEAPDGDRIEAARTQRVVPELFVPFRFRTNHGVLSFISTTTVFGTPMDVTLQELAIEAFLPADAFTLQAISQRIPASR